MKSRSTAVLSCSIWIGLAALLAGLCLARVSSVRLEDDNLYLIYASQSPTSGSQTLAREIISAVQSMPDCALESWRLTFRERYKSNYLAYTGTQQLIQSLFSPSFLTAPMAMVAGLIAAKASYFLLMLGLVIVAAMRAREVELRTATVLALSLLAAFDVIAQWLPTFWIVDIERPVRAVMQIGYSLVFAHDAHSLFGVTPRNAALAVFALAFLLKWQGRTAWASFAVLALGLLHQTYGGLAVFFFCVAGAVSEPAVFERVSVRAMLTLSAVMYLLREQYWGSIGFAFEAALVLVVIVVAQLAFGIARSRAFCGARQKLLKGFADQAIALDATSLVLLAILTTIICLIGGQVTEDPISRLYFWSDLTIRIWSLIRFPVLIAVLYYIAQRAPLRDARRVSILYTALVVTCAALTAVALTQVDWLGWRRLGQEAAHLDSVPTASVLRPLVEEVRIYYLLAAVAAGQLDAEMARERLYRERPVQCGLPPKDGARR